MRNNIARPFSWYTDNIDKLIFRTCLTAIFILFIERFILIFSYEGHLAGIDNNFDFPVIRWLAGFSIYPNPNEYPYVVNPYGPVFFIVCKWTASLFHTAAEDTLAVYRISRSVAFIADTATGLLFFQALRKFANCSKSKAILFTSFFYAILCYLGYTFNRSDCLFLLFYSCSLFLLFSARPASASLNAFWMAVSVTLTIFSKQNGISLLLLIPVWLILIKDYRRLGGFVFFTLILVAGTFYYFQFVFTDHTFSDHVVRALKNKIDPHWFYVHIFKLLADSHLVFPLAVAAVISIKSMAGNKDPLLARLGILFIIQILFSAGLSLKWGSSLGYFNESYFIGFLVIARYFNSLQVQQFSRQISVAAGYFYPVLLIFFFHVIAQFYFYFLNEPSKTKQLFNEQLEVSNYLKKEIGSNEKYVLNLSNPDRDFFKNLLYRESAAPDFDAVDCCTLPDHIFDYHGLLEGLATGKILFLIEKKGNIEDSLWGVGLSSYRIDRTFTHYTLYRFQPGK